MKTHLSTVHLQGRCFAATTNMLDFRKERPSNKPYRREHLWASANKICPMRGISSGAGVAQAVILNGKYGDTDCFNTVVYTGEGGLDLASGSVTMHQKLKLGNRALLKAHRSGSQVLVFRGSKAQAYPCTSPGRFRFDGVYKVATWWQECTPKGVVIYKFELKRAANDGGNRFLGPWPRAAAPKLNLCNMRARFTRRQKQTIVCRPTY